MFVRRMLPSIYVFQEVRRFEPHQALETDRRREGFGVPLLLPLIHVLADLGDQRRKELLVRRVAECLVRREPPLYWSRRSGR
jgi:hypothetical protein